MCTSDGFDPNTYKLMEELGYDFSKPPSPGHVIYARPRGGNDTKKIEQKERDGLVTPKVGVSYFPSQSAKIS